MINIDTRLLQLVDASEMWLLLHLTKRINIKERTCWPSNKTLCKDTGWNIDKLQKVKKSLVDREFIEVMTRPDSSNIYKIKTAALAVYINVTDVEFEEGDPVTPTGKSGIPPAVESGTPPTLFSGIPHTGKSGNKQLANEQLTTEQAVGGSLKNTEKAVGIIEALNTIKEEYGLKIGKKGEVHVTKERKAMIEARLKEFKAVTMEEIHAMLEHRCKVWKGTKFEKFIRIETLFQASKFMGYIEEAEAAPDKDWTERNRQRVTYEQSVHEDQVTPNMTSNNKKYEGLW